jgi:hypothetical protein
MTEPIDTTPPSPTAMPAHLPGTEPADTETATKLDESGWDPAAVTEIRALRRENANWRTKYREAEQDMESAVSRLNAMQHAEVERIASQHLLDPGDIWRTGADVDFSNELGELDAGKVAEAAQSLIADRPHLARPTIAPPPTNRPVEGLRPERCRRSASQHRPHHGDR